MLFDSALRPRNANRFETDWHGRPKDLMVKNVAINAVGFDFDSRASTSHRTQRRQLVVSLGKTHSEIPPSRSDRQMAGNS